MNIFEQLDLLLLETEKSKVKESEIPIHPERETKEQGKIVAAEEYLKIFQNFDGGGLGGIEKEEVIDSAPPLPDSIIDPKIDKMTKSPEKTFEKNKLLGPDDIFKDKYKKEIKSEGEKDDDFLDDFDYRDNKFGDDDDEPKGGEPGEPRGGEPGEPRGGKGHDSEVIKNLKDALKDGIDRLSELRERGGEAKSNPIDKHKFDELKKAIDSNDDNNIEDIHDKINDIKNPKKEIPGERMDKTPSDESFRKDMEKAGLDKESIDKILKGKNSRGHYSEKELKKMADDAVKTLVSDAEEKGKPTSSLAKTYAKHCLSQSIKDGEWRGKLEEFLKKKSDLNKGDLSTSYDGVGFDHRRLIHKGMVLPKIDVKSNNSTIKNIYCFIDFSRSCEQNLVYTFLGKVISLASLLKYTKVQAYGFANNLTSPFVLNNKSLEKGEKGIKEELDKMWKSLQTDISGGSIENFLDVAMEIRDIRKKEKDAIILIFGDAEWPEYKQEAFERRITFKYKSKHGTVGPLSLKDVLDKSFLENNICVLVYYLTNDPYYKERCENNVSVLRNIVGIKNIIALPSDDIETI